MLSFFRAKVWSCTKTTPVWSLFTFEQSVCQLVGFSSCFPVISRTYPAHVPADLFFLTLGMKTSVLMEIMPEISCSTTHFTFQHTSRPVFCTVQHLQLCIFGAAPLTMPQIVESISADTKSRRCHRENVRNSMCEETLCPSWQVSRCDTVSLVFGFCCAALLPGSLLAWCWWTVWPRLCILKRQHEFNGPSVF